MDSQKEKLLKETYDTFLNLILYDSPLDHRREYIANDVMGYGTTLDEKILDISRLRKLVIDQREQGAEAEFHFDVIPVFRRVAADQEAAIFVDEIKISMLIDGAKNEIPLRFSSVFYYLDEKWMLVHLHGSVAVETEDDTWHINEWQRKNEELQKLVEEKTSELLNKNRELEIETALEKVRSSALAMREPTDMLDVCRIISDQLQSLGVNDIRNVQTAIFYETKETYINFEYYTKHNKTLITEVDYKTHKLQELFASKMIKGVEELFSETLWSKELKDWYAYQKTTNQFADIYLETADSLSYYWYSLGPVALGMSTYAPLNEQEINLFKRFRNVFELAYRRFMDIQQAEAQAKEAKIEAALEKARAVAMSMTKPDDLLNICELLFKEFHSLGFSELRNAMINIHNDEKGTFLNYDYSDEIGKSINYLTYNIHPVIEKQIKQIRSANDAFSETSFTGKDLEDWKEFRNKIGEKDDPRINESSALYYYFYSIGTGSIGISTFSSINVEKLELLKRFRNVFSLSYQRYLDIALAEAQTREAQIELSLERVRARTMAMHHSNELSETAAILFQQLNELGFAPDRINIGIVKEDVRSIELWSTDQVGNKISNIFKASIDEPTTWSKIYSAWKAKKKSLVIDLSGKELNEWIRYVREEMHMFVNEEVLKKNRRVHSISYFSQGFIIMATLEPLPAEKINVLERFALVFNQTYTRFLDLQKAEAQAREAQIELGLERVRARAMSMQHSAELAELVDTVFKELTKLHFTLKRCQIMIMEKDGKTLRTWMANPEIDMTPNSYLLFLNDHPYFQSIMKAWEDKQPRWIYQLIGAEKDAMVKYVFNETEFRFLPEMVKAGMIQTKSIYFNSSYNNFGSLQVDTLEPLSDENLDIIYRFAKVFDQTYSRFLDLQKAEAQAREAKIEAALEKVRSRTMAMQRSDELAGTSAVVFKQLINLGVEPNRIYIAIIKDETGSVEFWITDEDGSKVSTGFTADLNDNISFKKMYDGWREQKMSITIDMQGKELEEYFKHLSKLNVPFKGGLSQKRRIQNIAYFSKGFIGIASPDLLQAETIDLLKRFAAVFNLTYTRFSDLQQAEAQNKIIQAENDRKTKELEDARQLQLSMLPKELPKLPHLDIAVYMKTATEVGGDYYDFYVQPDGTLTVLVGDATGHGMMSGMMVSIMKSFFISNRMNIELKHFFENSNNSIKDMHLGRLMMPLMGVQITSEKVIATNAGMPSLLYFRNKSQKAGEFVSNNMPLGAMKGTKYLLKEIKYEKGDTLLLMTDGFAELKNENDKQYGYAQVKEEFVSVAQKDPDQIVEYLKHSAFQWSNRVEPDDDVTFVVIKVK